MSIDLKRREFILSAIKMGVSIPILELLLKSENSMAETSSSHPEAIIFFYTSNGMLNFEYPTSMLTGPFTTLAPNVRKASLVSLAGIYGEVSSIVSKNKFNLNHVSMIRGIDWSAVGPGPASDHTPPSITSGTYVNNYTAKEASIDQIINKAIQGSAPLGVITASAGIPEQGTGGQWSFMRSGAAVYSIGSENRPNILYETLLSQVVTNPQDIQKIKNKRTSVANLVSNQFSRLLTGGKKILSKNDRNLLSQHSDLVQSQLRRIEALNSTTIPIPPPPTLVQTHLYGDVYTWAGDQAIARLKAQVDNFVMARALGLSKVMVLHIPETDLFMGHHGASHENVTGNAASKLPIEKLYMEEVFAYLISRLDSVLDVDGKTLLEKTLCVHNNSSGACGNAHMGLDFPVLMASRHPSFKASGQYLDFRNHNQFREYYDAGVGRYVSPYRRGTQLSRYFITLAQAMGLTPDQYISTTTGTIGEAGNEYGQYEESKKNATLEGVL